MQSTIILGSAVAIALLVACGTKSRPPVPTRQLTEADAGHVIELPVGGRLEVRLQGNPTAGFQWEVGSCDESVVKWNGKPEFNPSNDALGAPGTFASRFEAVGVGQTKLNLVYRRPFEKETPPVRTFEVTVVVK